MRRLLPRLAAAVALLGLGWPGEATLLAREFATAQPSRRVELMHRLVAEDPRGAAPTLAVALRDADPAVRDAALALAARAPSEELLPALRALLDDASEAVRGDAAAALGAVPGSGARAALGVALADRAASVRARAAASLVGSGADALVPLLDRVHDADGSVRAAAVGALGRIGDERAALSLVGVAGDPLPEVRLAVASSLGRIGGPGAERTLAALVGDADHDVRVAAIGALHGAREPLTVATLAARADPERGSALGRVDDTALPAIAALGSIASPAALDALVALALRGNDVLGSAALRALIPHRTALRSRAAAITARVPADRVEALAPLLGLVGGSDAARLLIDASARSTPPSDALWRALGDTGATEALDDLVDRLGAPRREPDARLLDALARWADANDGLPGASVDLLRTALADLDLGHPAPRRALLALLGRTGHPRAVPPLCEALAAGDASVRLEAARALESVADGAAVRPLVEALGDADARVRTAAAAALGHAPPDDARTAMLDRWRDARAVDRAALLVALGRSAAAAPDHAAEVVALLREVSARGSERLRTAALRALGSVAATGDAAACGVLRDALGEAAVMRPASTALGDARAACDADGALLGALDAAADPWDRATLAWSLRGGGDGTVRRLEAVAREATGPAALAAVAALARSVAAPPTDTGTGPTPRGPRRETDLRIVDVDGAPWRGTVRVVLGDGVTLPVIPDVDGWVRVTDDVPGALRVLRDAP